MLFYAVLFQILVSSGLLFIFRKKDAEKRKINPKTINKPSFKKKKQQFNTGITEEEIYQTQ